MFGVPTIRKDINKKSIKSVADINNYGDEPAAIHLLNPEKFSAMGLSPQDLKQKRDPEEIKDIFQCIGIPFSPAKFMALISRATQLEGGCEQVSLLSFMKAMESLAHLE